jgi:transposase
MREHCAHTRYVWNLAVEQQSWWKRGRRSAPGYLEQCRQLTAVRREWGWLRAGSQMVQQQALRDFDQAMRSFFAGSQGKPRWRKAGRHEGFRIVGVKGRQWDVRRLNRRAGEVWVPEAGWVRFRWSRAVPPAKSYRVTLDRAGRWHVAFAAIPSAVQGPGTAEVVGVDRGVAVSAALSTGEMLSVPRLSPGRQRRLILLQRRLARAQRGSNRRAQTRLATARLKAREADARKDWAEKVSTDLARRIEKVSAAFTSQRCSACGHVAAESRKSQSWFRCVACCFACDADTNAAINIAAGHAVHARRADRASGAVKREPQHNDLQVA